MFGGRLFWQNLFFIYFIFLLTPPCLIAQEIAFEHADKIERILTDQKGNIFLGTRDDIAAFDGNKLRFHSPEIEQKITIALVIDAHHKIIGTDTSIYIVNQQDISKKIHLAASITAMTLCDSLLFIGTAGQGLLKYNLITDQLSPTSILSDVFINDLELFNNELWVALDNGITVLSTNNFEQLFHLDFEENIIAHLQKKDQENLLVFSQFGKIYQLSPKGKIVYESKTKISSILKVASNLASTFILTKKACLGLDDSLNFSLFSKGNYADLLVHENLLFLAKGNELIQFDITQKLLTASKNNYALFVDNNHLLWTGGNGKIQCLNKGSLVQTYFLPATSAEIKVTALYVTSEEIYAGTLGDGLYIFNKKGKLIDHLMATGDDNKKNIIQIKEKDDLIWVAYLNGILTVNPISKDIQNDFEALIGDNYLYCFYPISQNEVYVGTSAHGVIRIKDKKVNTFLEKTTIYSITQHENSLIIATEDAGLFKIGLENQTVSTIQNTIDFNEVLNVIPLGKQLLIATTKSIFLYNDQTGLKCALPKITNSEMHLNSSTFYGQNIYVGHDEGVLCLNNSRLLELGRLVLNLQIPKLFEQTIVTDKHTFNYYENTFSFNYHSNNYYQSSNTYYQYRMLGMDSLWQASNQSIVNYYKMSPGQYTFEVASGVHPQFAPVNALGYSFTIKQPFWKRLWFILLAITFILLAIYYFVRRRETRLLAREELKQAKLKFKLQQLERQINPHFLFNSLNSLIGLIEEDAPAAAIAAEKMSNLYRNILQYQNIDSISIEEELYLAQQYFDIHKLRYFDLITIELLNCTPKENQFLVPLSCQFLIENALKHNTISKKNKLKINITIEGDYLIVSNNLTSKPQNVASTKTGLVNLNKRYQHLTNKSIEIEQSNQVFKVKLPIIYA